MNIIENRFNIQNPNGKRIVKIKGFGRNDLAKLFAELNFNRGVEIGTERGKYAWQLCTANPNLKLYCIDPWKHYDDARGYKDDTNQGTHNNNYEDAQKRLSGFDCTLFKSTSMNKVHYFEDGSLDFVYIDGNHRLEYVIDDLYEWTKKVKIGGIVAGHDYIKLRGQHYSHVPYALEAYLQSYPSGVLFLLDQKKGINNEEDKRLDRVRSWFFIKQ